MDPEIENNIILIKKPLKTVIFGLLLSTVMVSCAKIDLFEKQVSIPSQQWTYSDQPVFSFDIRDTTALYNIYIILRHTDAYEYNNIWLRLGSKAPGDSVHYQNIDLSLATDLKGWDGTGMDDIYEVRKIITPGPVPFKKTGIYNFTVEQIMRENPLKHILSVGLRVEKVNQP